VGIALIVAAVVAVAIGVGVWSNKLAKKRRAAIAAWATEHGLLFGRQRMYGFDKRFPDFQFLARGKDRYAYNVANGDVDGLHVTAFDYHYATEHRDSEGRRTTTHHHQSILVVRPPFKLANLQIRREGLFDRIAQAFGANDIDFESAEFSERFRVKADDRKWAYDVISPKTMALLLDGPEFSIDMGSSELALHKGGRLDAEEYEQALVLARQLLEYIPHRLRQTAGI